jgi:hypothetical protein
MRGAFGLVSLLITGLIVAYLWADHTKTVANVNKTLQPQVQQLAGRSSDGTPAIKSATYKELPGSGPIKGAQVVTIDPAGGLAVYWGLLPNDIIREVGPYAVGDNTLTDLETVQEWVVEGMQRQMTMAVDRGGVRISLPAGRAAGSPGTGGGPLILPPVTGP